MVLDETGDSRPPRFLLARVVDTYIELTEREKEQFAAEFEHATFSGLKAVRPCP